MYEGPDIRRFVDLLVKATQKERPGIYVLLSIRSDFIEASCIFQITHRVDEQEQIPFAPDVTRIFVCVNYRPCQQIGVRFESGFVEYLLDDLDDMETPLPQLQHSLVRTWDHWAQQGDKDQPISIRDYQAVGSVKSALSDHLEEAFEELDENQKLICERLFKSITAKSEQYNGFSRQASLGNIARIAHCSIEDLSDVVEVFRRQGRAFLSPNSSFSLTSESIIDLSHESLIQDMGQAASMGG